MRQLLEGTALAVQMVAAGLERGESPTTILSRIIQTGAVNTAEEGDEAYRLGRIAFSAGAQMSLGNPEAANRLLGQLAGMGAGDWVATARVQVLPPKGQPPAAPFISAAGDEEQVWRTIQVRLGGGADAVAMAAAAQEVADALEDGQYTALFGAGATYSAPLFYSVVRLP